MSTIAVLTATESGANSLTDINNNFANLNTDKLEASSLHSATGKTTPVDADELPIVDSASSFSLKKLTWANLKATIKTYTDTLYVSGSGTSSGTNTGDVTLAGSPNYITIAGQVITRALIDLTAHVTGILPVGNGGTGVTSSTGSGANVLGTSPTLATPVINGLPTGTGVASASTVSTLMSRDANGNSNINNIIEGYTTTATSAGTLTLTIASTYQQFLTGSTTHTVVLPVTSTLSLGFSYQIVNNSTGLVTVQSSGANNIVILGAGTSAIFTCILTSGTTASSWSYAYNGATVASGKLLTVSNTITFVATDGQTFTFPNGTSTVMTLASADTITGVKTFGDGKLVLSGATSGASTLKAPAIASTYVHTLPAGTDTLVGATFAQTLTNKRKQPRVYTATNNASLTPEIDTYDIFHLTAMSANTTINNKSTSTPADGELMEFRFLDNATARTLTWGTDYVAKAGIALPSTTVLSKNKVLLFEWNANLSKWNLLASGDEA